MTPILISLTCDVNTTVEIINSFMCCKQIDRAKHVVDTEWPAQLKFILRTSLSAHRIHAQMHKHT